MVQRSAEAEWRGGLSDGSGTIRPESDAFEASYSYGSRFEGDRGTNPEELIGAAHAACFSMALAANLSQKKFPPARIRTTAHVQLQKDGDGFAITESHLDTDAQIDDIDEATFQSVAEETKRTCPVSRALAGTKITLGARLVPQG